MLRTHFPKVMLTLLFTGLMVSATNARVIHANNVAGNDNNSGELENSTTPGEGPTKTIGKALEIAAFGDRIVVANTGQPYRECITLNGVGNSGSISFPFVIEGNGAILDGAAEIPPDCWHVVGKNLFAFAPKKKSFQQLFLDDKPTEGFTAEPQPNLLKPKQWCRIDGQIVFRTDKGKLPENYNLSHSVHSVGVTLYGVANVVIRDLIVQGYQLDGFNAADNAFDCELVNVTARGNGRSGISVGGASRVKVSESLLGDNRTAQVRTEGWSTTDVTDTEIIDKLAPSWQVDGGRLIVDSEEYRRSGSPLGKNPLHRSQQ